jgi:predicted enzyme related to lactoylglutathione lyase
MEVRMPAIVHFDIAADNPGRAKSSYERLFGWRMESPPGMTDYYLIETKDLEGKGGVGGGLGQRGEPGQKITVYIVVSSVEDHGAKVKKLGGKVVQPKMAVPGWGYLAICQDTENDTFGLWQEDKNAKQKDSHTPERHT